MDKSRKFVFDAENITDVEAETINETDDREIGSEEVEDIIEEHSQTVNNDPTNQNNINHPEPEIVDAETVTDSHDKAALAINGRMFLFMIDTVIPLIIKYGGESVNKKIEIDIDALKMDDEDKELLGPSAEHVADLIFGKLGPIPQFFIGLTIIYADKVPDAIKKKDYEEHN